MFTSRGRARGRRTVHRLAWNRLQVHSLEQRLSPAVLVESLYPDPTGPQRSALFGSTVNISANYRVVGAGNASRAAMTYAGAAFVYDSQNNLIASLGSPTPAPYQNFGRFAACNNQYVAIAGNNQLVYLFDMTAPTPTAPIATIQNPMPSMNDFFGAALAMTDEYLVVGAWGENVGVSQSGIAYVFDLGSVGPNMAPVTIFNNPDPETNDRFGTSVGISGTTVIVGAPGDNTGAAEAGAVYVFDIDSPIPTIPTVTIHNPQPNPVDRFGSSIAISGQHVAVGTPWDDYGQTNSGSAYIYDLLSPDPAAPKTTMHNPVVDSDAGFGDSVAITNGLVIVATSDSDIPDTDSGAVHVYDLAGVNPSVPAYSLVNPYPGSYASFGSSLAVDGTQLIVAAVGASGEASNSGIVEVFDLAGKNPSMPTTWLVNPTAAATVKFGTAVAASGKYLAVGAPYDRTGKVNAGLVYIFDTTSSQSSVPIWTLPKPLPAINDEFGASVAISGKYVVVGAPRDNSSGYAGSAYLFDLESPNPTFPIVTLKNPTPASDDLFGLTVSISGDYIIVGAPDDDTTGFNSGSAYVFNLKSPMPSTPILTLKNPTPGSDDEFGNSVAIDDQRVVVGAWRDKSFTGSAYVFDLTSPTPLIPTHTFQDPSGLAQSQFGRSVAIAGNRVAVRTAGYTTSQTAGVYLFDLNSSTPTVPIQTYLHSIAYDLKLSTMALTNQYIALGVYTQDIYASQEGRAFVYDHTSATPNIPVAVLYNPHPSNTEHFGSAAAFSGSHVFIGAWHDHDQNYQQGAVHRFALTAPTSTRIVVNDGQAQRSTVTSMAITFDQPINFADGANAAFQLQRQADGAVVELQATVVGNTVRLTFSNGPIEHGSLADGRYTLSIRADKISNANGSFDGNGDGIAGDNYVLVGTPANGLFRLFGDSNGDGIVSAVDHSAFRLNYHSARPTFDFDNDGIVSASDFQQFRMRYGVSLTP